MAAAISFPPRESPSSTLRIAAVDTYRQLGWSTIPLRMSEAGKQPMVAWKPFQDRRPTDFELAYWRDRFARCGIGVIAGPISNLLILDADGSDGVAEARRLGIPKTPMVQTPGGGLHAYFAWPLGMQPFKSSTKLGESKKIDVRGHGAYVAAPYTRRTDGKRYEWIERPEKTPLAAAPNWFLNLLKTTCVSLSGAKDSKRPARKHRGGPGPGVEGTVAALPEVLQTLVLNGHDLDRFPSRSECDAYVVTKLVAHGLCDEDIWFIFHNYPIGDKLRVDAKGNAVSESQATYYLTRTIALAQERLCIGKIKYADLIEYDGGGRRLQLCFEVRDEGCSRIVRTGLTVPRSEDDGVAERWRHFFEAVGVASSIDSVSLRRMLIGRCVRLEVDGKRNNPVIGFYAA